MRATEPQYGRAQARATVQVRRGERVKVVISKPKAVKG
jgi:hypothetical protein